LVSAIAWVCASSSTPSSHGTPASKCPVASGAAEAYGPVMDANDWLLPQPTTMTLTSGVVNADGSLNGPIFAEYVSMLGDDLAVSWPAFADDGAPVIPPDIHILDHLSRAWGLFDEEVLNYEYPIAAKTVYVMTGSLPGCNFCGEPARYDGSVLTPQGATHAWMCTQDARKVVDHLGSPSGYYYLMQAGEVPAGIRDRVNSRLGELAQHRGVQTLTA
jgi:hypothetical protein